MNHLHEIHFVDGTSIEVNDTEWNDYISGSVDYWSVI